MEGFLDCFVVERPVDDFISQNVRKGEFKINLDKEVVGGHNRMRSNGIWLRNIV